MGKWETIRGSGTEAAPSFALRAVHHVAIIVSDYEKSKDFYVNKLGFGVVRELYRPERQDWKLDLRVGEGPDAVELEIFGEQNPPKRVNRPEACGLRHLAFRVEDARAAAEELERPAFPVSPCGLTRAPAPTRRFSLIRTACRWSCTNEAQGREGRQNAWR